MKDEVYDILKFASLIIVPVCAFVASVVVAIKTQDVVAGIQAIGEAAAALLGTILVVASKVYWKKKENEDTDA